MATFANRNIYNKTQNQKSVLLLYYRTGDSVGEILKVGLPLDLDHLYYFTYFPYMLYISGFTRVYFHINHISGSGGILGK